MPNRRHAATAPPRPGDLPEPGHGGAERDPDMENDGECWQMANGIAGLGNTEQGFHEN